MNRPPTPVVALVGRPNVGKSTIFNRLVGGKRAIVHDRPGVTRDRHYGDVEAQGRRFVLIDTGGFDPSSDDPMRQGIKRHIELAIAEADVIICVLDAVEAPTATDHAELHLLRESGKPVVYIANKADNPTAEVEAAELYSLGMEALIPMSALHGRRVDELIDAIVERLPKLPEKADGETTEEEEALAPLRVAIVGKPNAGKSSLVNQLCGEERMLVDDRPGTTRDPIDTLVERDGRKFCFVDTAGIRRRAKVRKEYDFVEAVSVIQAMRAMENAEVVLLLCDAAEGVAEQDAKILGLAVDRGRAIVVGLNKTDQMDRKALAKAEEDARDKLSFIPWAPVTRLSAKTGRGVGQVLTTVARVAEAFRRRVGTGELNRFFEQVLADRPPPTHGGKAPRLFYITQAESAPPLFVVQANNPEQIHFSYQRYVINQIRKSFGFEGVPVKVRYKPRRRRGEEDTPWLGKPLPARGPKAKGAAPKPRLRPRGADDEPGGTSPSRLRPVRAPKRAPGAPPVRAGTPAVKPTERAGKPTERAAKPAPAKRAAAKPSASAAKPAAKKPAAAKGGSEEISISAAAKPEKRGPSKPSRKPKVRSPGAGKPARKNASRG